MADEKTSEFASPDACARALAYLTLTSVLTEADCTNVMAALEQDMASDTSTLPPAPFDTVEKNQSFIDLLSTLGRVALSLAMLVPSHGLTRQNVESGVARMLLLLEQLATLGDSLTPAQALPTVAEEEVAEAAHPPQDDDI